MTVIIPDDAGNLKRDYEFFKGHIVAVKNKESGEVYKGVVQNLSRTSLRIQIGESETIPYDSRIELREADDDDLAVAGLLHPIKYQRELEAISNFRLGLDKRRRILGRADLTFTNTAAENSNRHDSEIYYNPEQAEGTKKALAADDIACLQGPPGTGKTRVILELVQRLVEAGNRVLVSAETNTAADNILIGENDEEDRDAQSLHIRNSALHSFGSFVVARNNPVRSDSQVVHDYYFDIQTESAKVVVTTNNSAAKLENQHFDTVIVDEAAQATLSSTLIPYLVSDKIILVGDHKQMPPERQSSKTGENDQRHLSLFQHIYDEDFGTHGPEAGVQFKTQYRMHPDIASIPNQLFYDGNLENGVDPEPLLSHPVVLFDIENSSEQWYSSSPYNESEAHLALLQAKYLIERGVSGSEIGIITPYTGQVRRIGELIREVDEPEYSDIKVNTIAAFQGSEKPATIISFTRANDHGNVGFLDREDGPNRLNVALSRGKRYTGLIGNWETLRTHDLYDELYQLATISIPPKEFDSSELEGQFG